MPAASRPTDAELLAVVQESPTAVAAHDKAAWLSLFAPNAVVNDPVGSAPHVGEEAISRFYDMFIAPNDISFDAGADVVCQMTVIRDLTIHTAMAPGVLMHIPAHLRYELELIDGVPRIRGLYAHWELIAMIGQLLGTGIRGARVGAAMAPRMLRTLGISGIVGFASGLRSVGSAPKRRVAQQAAAQGFRVGKVIAAGREVTVSVSDGDRRGILRYRLAGRGVPTVTRYLAPVP